MKIHLSCQENLSCNGFLHVSVISHLRCYLKNTLVHSIFKRKRERKVRLEQGWRGVFRRSALLYRLQQSGTCNTIKAESVMGNISRNILMSVTFFPLSLLNTWSHHTAAETKWPHHSGNFIHYLSCELVQKRAKSKANKAEQIKVKSRQDCYVHKHVKKTTTCIYKHIDSWQIRGKNNIKCLCKVLDHHVP